MEIKNKKELEFVIKADRMMNRGKFNRSFKDFLMDLILPDPIMKYLRLMRKTSYYKHSGGGILFAYYFRKWEALGRYLGFSIGYDTLGYGVVIPHHGTIVIGRSNRIGNYAVIHTCVCISDNEKVIGDNLYLATGAKLTSKLTLGNSISIGANSLVNKSFVENNVLLGGIPAKIIRNEETWYTRDSFENRVRLVEDLKLKYNIFDR